MRFVLALAVCGSLGSPLAAQAFISRSPNVDGTWLPEHASMQFNLVHRFYVTGDASHTVINSPTLTWAFRLPSRFAVAARYSSRSAMLAETNDLELFGRVRLRESGVGQVGLAITPAWNLRAHSFDGEVAADWSISRFTVTGALRGMSNAYGSDRARGAVAGGVVARLNDYVGLGGDVASLLNVEAGERTAWSAGLLFQIPNSPHFFSLQVSNVDVNTIQGASRRGLLSSGVDKLLYGFEFTIPLHYKRFMPWFRPGTGVPPKRQSVVLAAKIQMAEFEFRSDSVVIGVGQAIEFVNADPVEHTVTFDAIATSSGMVPKGGTFVLRFDRPGRWEYHCTPHPFMRGIIIVR